MHKFFTVSWLYFYQCSVAKYLVQNQVFSTNTYTFMGVLLSDPLLCEYLSMVYQYFHSTKNVREWQLHVFFPWLTQSITGKLMHFKDHSTTKMYEFGTVVCGWSFLPSWHYTIHNYNNYKCFFQFTASFCTIIVSLISFLISE